MLAVSDILEISIMVLLSIAVGGNWQCRMLPPCLHLQAVGQGLCTSCVQMVLPDAVRSFCCIGWSVQALVLFIDTTAVVAFQCMSVSMWQADGGLPCQVGAWCCYVRFLLLYAVDVHS